MSASNLTALRHICDPLLANHRVNFGKKHYSSKKKIKDFFKSGSNGRNATLSLPKLGRAALVSDASALILDVDFDDVYARPKPTKIDKEEHLKTEEDQVKLEQTLPTI